MRPGTIAAWLVGVLALGCGRIGYAHTRDAGEDAFAVDASTDAALDAPRIDAGTDVGVDAAQDVGVDVGVDAFALVDECLVANGGCSPNATCTDLPVGRFCQCIPHFAGDGVTCAAIIPSVPMQDGFIKASNTGGTDYFGRVVALSADGQTLAVGANYEDGASPLIDGPDNNDATVAGAVYIYRRIGSTWTFEAYVKANNPGTNDEFGYAIALSADGNTLAVGARDEDGSGSGVNIAEDDAGDDCGAVYMYRRVGSTWSFDAYIKANNTGNGDEFGAALALSGDGTVLAVGAHLEDSSSTRVDGASNEDAMDSGAVYVYRRGLTGAGLWRFEAFIKAGETSAFDEFGGALALNGDGTFLAVGARLEDSNTTGVNPAHNELATGSGAVWVYEHVGAWTLNAFIKAPNTGAEDEFGVSVALSTEGDVLAIGASREDSGGNGVGVAFDESAVDSGAAYLYRRSGSRWEFASFIKSPNSDAGDLFGGSIALSGDGFSLLVGATHEDGGSTGAGGPFNEDAFDSGAVYLYRTLLTASGWGFDQYMKASNTGTEDAFGTSVALSGDGIAMAVTAVNEDSDTTGVDAMPNDDGSDCGAAYVFR